MHFVNQFIVTVIINRASRKRRYLFGLVEQHVETKLFFSSIILKAIYSCIRALFGKFRLFSK